MLCERGNLFARVDNVYQCTTQLGFTLLVILSMLFLLSSYSPVVVFCVQTDYNSNFHCSSAKIHSPTSTLELSKQISCQVHGSSHRVI